MTLGGHAASIPGMKRIGVLFVCLGNICRSPLAEGVFRAEVRRRGKEDLFDIDSCGTGGWHAGENPDRRSQAVARAHGLDISRHRARQLAPEDFGRFPVMVAMDPDNAAVLRRHVPAGASTRVIELVDFLPGGGETEVPDPYYGGIEGFERVYALLARGSGPLADDLLAGAAGGEPA